MNWFVVTFLFLFTTEVYGQAMMEGMITSNIPAGNDLIELPTLALRRYLNEVKRKSIIYHLTPDCQRWDYYPDTTGYEKPTHRFHVCVNREVTLGSITEIVQYKLAEIDAGEVIVTRTGQELEASDTNKLISLWIPRCHQSMECSFEIRDYGPRVRIIHNQSHDHAVLNFPDKNFRMEISEERDEKFQIRTLAIQCSNCSGTTQLKVVAEKSASDWFDVEHSYYTSQGPGRVTPRHFNAVLGQIIYTPLGQIAQTIKHYMQGQLGWPQIQGF